MKEINPTKQHTKLKDLKKNQEKIKQEKIFLDPVEDNPINPTSATYALKGNYVVLSSSIKEKRKILLKYSSILISHAGRTFFIVRLPKKYEVHGAFLNLLNSNEITIKKHFRLTFESLKIIHLHDDSYEKNEKLPKKWEARIPLMRADFAKINEQNCASYALKQDTHNFPLFFRETEKTVKGFLSLYGNRATYDAYIFYLRLLVGFHTGIIGQFQINKALISTYDVRMLVPSSLSLERILKHKEIEKINHSLIFSYKTEKWLELKYADISQKKQNQAIFIPFELLSYVFNPESFGNRGLNYFLMIIFGYRFYKKPQVKYKPSTIIELANINAKRGIQYTIHALNRPLKYFKKIGIISSYTEITKNIIKEDKPIKIYLKPLKYWKEPEKYFPV